MRVAAPDDGHMMANGAGTNVAALAHMNSLKILAVLLCVACSSTTDDGAGGGGAGGQTTGGQCFSCVGFFDDGDGLDLTIADTCGYNGTGCDAGTSCELLTTLSSCWCQGCEADCVFCGAASDSTGCETCLGDNQASMCSAEKAACEADM